MSTPSGSTILIGTRNPAKFARYSELLHEACVTHAVRTMSPDSLGCEVQVVEDGQTAAENAERKARMYAEASGLPTLAVDEALEIVGLPPDQQPGVHVRRYGGRKRGDEEIVDLLLEKIRGIPAAKRRAIWTWAICLALPGADVYSEEVIVRDSLADTKRLPIPVGYPLSLLMIDRATGKRVCDLTKLEAAARLRPASDAVRRIVAQAFPRLDGH